jgi:LPS sulfotransferase NodH
MSNVRHGRCLVTGAGRSGTNLLTEHVRAAGVFEFTRRVEDRTFFDHELPPGYATKLATENKGFTAERLLKRMSQYPDLCIIFSMRHPVSLCMAKIVRGQKRSQGGDTAGEVVCPDGVTSGAIAAVRHADAMYEAARQAHTHRVFSLHMENLVKAPHAACCFICKFLGTDVPDKMQGAQKNSRNRYHKARYGKQLVQSAVDQQLDPFGAYDGFFQGREDDIKRIRVETEDICRRWNYEAA